MSFFHPVDVSNRFKIPVYVIHIKHRRLTLLSLCGTPFSLFQTWDAWLTLSFARMWLIVKLHVLDVTWPYHSIRSPKTDINQWSNSERGTNIWIRITPFGFTRLITQPLNFVFVLRMITQFLFQLTDTNITMYYFVPFSKIIRENKPDPVKRQRDFTSNFTHPLKKHNCIVPSNTEGK